MSTKYNYSFRALLAIAVVVNSGFLLSSCVKGKQDPAPYYQFLPSDREWLQFSKGNTWVFENARGARHQFRVDTVVLREHEAAYSHPLGGGPGSVLYYFDQFSMHVASLDSSGRGGTFKFVREPQDGNTSKPVVFRPECVWYNYLGIDSGSGGFIPYVLNLPLNLGNPSFKQLTIRNVSYTHIIEINATTTSTIRGQWPLYTATVIKQILYDQQAGIIRLLSISGEVWERVP